MQDRLTHHDFAPHIAQTFELSLDGQSLPLTLEEVKYLRKGHREDLRDQFSVVFKGPAEPLLPQHTYELRHESMGELPLFLVAVGREEGRNHETDRPVLYEAVFA